MRTHQNTRRDRSVDPADAGVFAVLDSARKARQTADAAEVEILVSAVEWARLHEVEDIDQAAQWIPAGAGPVGIALAGEGAPLVAEWCVAELAAVLGLSSEAGKKLIADALELTHRLPRLWTRVQAGEVTVWRARRVAAETSHLCVDAVDYVDRQVAPFAHSVSGPAIERLVADATARFMPELAEQQAAQAADQRCFEIDHQQVSFAGTSRVYGELDLADAIDLDTAVAMGAEQLKMLGSTDTLDVRRSLAAGELARRQLALGFETGDDDAATGAAALALAGAGFDPGAGHAEAHPSDTIDSDGVPSGDQGPLRQPPRPAEAGDQHIGDAAARPPSDTTRQTQPHRPEPTRPVREVVIYAHLSAETITDPGSSDPDNTGSGFARVENTGTKLLTPEQIATWCRTDAAKVTVRPVIDLNDSLSSTSYEAPDRIREQIILRDRTCCFPHCHRTARRADLDHIDPWDAGGPTTTENLAALCRQHHRYKTLHGWHYRRTGPATYEWTSPHGHRFEVGPRGTQCLDPAPAPADRPRPETGRGRTPCPHTPAQPPRRRRELPTRSPRPSEQHRLRRTS